MYACITCIPNQEGSGARVIHDDRSHVDRRVEFECGRRQEGMQRNDERGFVLNAHGEERMEGLRRRGRHAAASRHVEEVGETHLQYVGGGELNSQTAAEAR